MSKAKEDKKLRPNHKHAGEAGAIAGEIVGGLVGSAAGPVGTIAGMVLGAVAGGLAGGGMDAEAEREHVHDEELDHDIGVIGGDLGSVRPGATPARINAPSLASAGVPAHAQTPAEGPLQDLDDDG